MNHRSRKRRYPPLFVGVCIRSQAPFVQKTFTNAWSDKSVWPKWLKGFTTAIVPDGISEHAEAHDRRVWFAGDCHHPTTTLLNPSRTRTLYNRRPVLRRRSENTPRFPSCTPKDIYLYPSTVRSNQARINKTWKSLILISVTTSFRRQSNRGFSL